MNTIRRWRFIALATALLFTLVTPPSAPAAPVSSLSATTLRGQLIYFERSGRTVDRALALNEMSARSAFEVSLWNNFLAAWDKANTAQKLNYTPPKGLPGKGHVFVVLGGSLSSSGGITTQLKNRLKVALAALAAYPNSQVLVSGGAPKNGHTEAEVMRAYLIDQGIASSRIMTESKSSSTVGNAKYSMAILKSKPAFTSYTLISDASHIRRASVLFNAASLKIQLTDGKPWAMAQLLNVAHKDKTITNPPNDATMSVIASNAASVLGISSTYSGIVAKPPKPAVLTALKVAPAKTTYQVGSSLSRSAVKATAVFDQGSLSVTTKTKISGFSSKKVGNRKVTVTFATGGIAKSSSFTVSVVKAKAKIKASPSTKTVHKKKTRLTVRLTLTSATGVVPAGTVRIYVGSKRVKTLTLKTSAKGKISYKLPVFTSTGTKKVKITYAGSTKVTTAKTTLTVKVKK